MPRLSLNPTHPVHVQLNQISLHFLHLRLLTQHPHHVGLLQHHLCVRHVSSVPPQCPDCPRHQLQPLQYRPCLGFCNGEFATSHGNQAHDVTPLLQQRSLYNAPLMMHVEGARQLPITQVQLQPGEHQFYQLVQRFRTLFVPHLLFCPTKQPLNGLHQDFVVWNEAASPQQLPRQLLQLFKGAGKLHLEPFLHGLRPQLHLVIIKRIPQHYYPWCKELALL